MILLICFDVCLFIDVNVDDCRVCCFVGLFFGILVVCIFLWWWWLEVIGFIIDFFVVIMMVGIVICDFVYFFVFVVVCKIEVMFDDGILVVGWLFEV